MRQSRLAAWFLRAGLSFVFMYASIEIYMNPQNFLKYTPDFVLNLFPENVFLYGFGLFEILLAIWLLIQWRSAYSSLIAAMLLAGIVICNIEHFQVLFRNIAIVFGSLALWMLEKKSQKVLR